MNSTSNHTTDNSSFSCAKPSFFCLRHLGATGIILSTGVFLSIISLSFLTSGSYLQKIFISIALSNITAGSVSLIRSFFSGIRKYLDEQEKIYFFSNNEKLYSRYQKNRLRYLKFGEKIGNSIGLIGIGLLIKYYSDIDNFSGTKIVLSRAGQIPVILGSHSLLMSLYHFIQLFYNHKKTNKIKTTEALNKIHINTKNQLILGFFSFSLGIILTIVGSLYLTNLSQWLMLIFGPAFLTIGVLRIVRGFLKPSNDNPSSLPESSQNHLLLLMKKNKLSIIGGSSFVLLGILFTFLSCKPSFAYHQRLIIQTCGSKTLLASLPIFLSLLGTKLFPNSRPSAHQKSYNTVLSTNLEIENEPATQPVPGTIKNKQKILLGSVSIFGGLIFILLSVITPLAPIHGACNVIGQTGMTAGYYLILLGLVNSSAKNK